MGLFSRLGKKNKKKAVETNAEKKSDGLELFSGMRMEVTDASSGELLFIAKFMYPRGDKAELHHISSGAATQNSDGTNVLIRGYNDKDSKAVWMEGKIRSDDNSSNYFAENLKLKKTGNDRAFFRLNTNIGANINYVSKSGLEEIPCELLNISIGGACISSDKKFHKGDRLLLKVNFDDNSDSMLIRCHILRITNKSRNRDEYYEYGCRFEALSENEQDKITKSIFELQRKKLSKS